jgi:D-alanyl-D-alanine carboxypeptidase (penicillin-binding protein 5/6)
MKKIISFFLVFLLAAGALCLPAHGAEFTEDITAKGAVLMDAATDRILFEYNADEALPPASVTKIMTLLLVFEEIDSGALKLTDMITASETAASMGGTQIYLEPGEKMSAEDLIKSVVISSANDAACALAEHIAGSESAFVAKMNERARELGMNNTNFENTNGLDDTTKNHVISARDIAIMSRELMKHEKIFDYTTVWMDTVRNGEFGLSNTNRLLRTYSGCTGLKTGSTSKAKFCISATAKRGELSLIAVVMGAPTKEERNALAAKLLDFGFANYALFSENGAPLNEIMLTGGTKNTLKVEKEGFSALLEKGEIAKIKSVYDLPESIAAPVKKGDTVGTVTYKCGETVVGKANIVAAEDGEKMTFFTMMWKILRAMMCGE